MRGAACSIVLAIMLVGCVVNRWMAGRNITGTCSGACNYYASCKGDDDRARRRCATECPEVFSDARSLEAYESLSCQDAVEFIDGRPDKAARSR